MAKTAAKLSQKVVLKTVSQRQKTRKEVCNSVVILLF